MARHSIGGLALLANVRRLRFRAARFRARRSEPRPVDAGNPETHLRPDSHSHDPIACKFEPTYAVAGRGAVDCLADVEF